MRPSHGHPSQECAATQRESQASEDIGAIAPPVDRGWGRLWPLTQNLTHVDLKAEEVRLGRRPTCAVVLDARMLPASVFGSVVTLISGDHCRIYRKEGTTTVDENAIPTFIEDLSSNGTFINYQKLGKGEHKLLKHGDRIDLVRPSRCSDTAPVAYMFEEFSSLNKSFKEHEKALGGQYILSRELGAGNFSRVYHGYRNGKTEVALKCIDKRRFWSTPKTKEQLLREADILRDVKHPNIITVYDVIDSEQFLYLVLELASGGELFDMIRQRGNITEDEARSIFNQMFSAVAYLHKRGIAHRDLKPENILFSSKEAGSPVKITDFGLARIIGENVPSGTLCGTPQYVAPEIISLSSTPAESRRGYGVAVDMWSLGVMLYVLLSGIFPFDEAVRPGSLFQQIELGTYDFPPEYFHSVSTGAKELIRSLLKVNPAERITAEAALAHPWITQPPSAQPTVLSLGRASSNHKADDTPDKAKPTVDTDDEGSGGTKRARRETLEAEQFSPEIIKSFRLKIPATPLERKKLTFST